MEQRELIFFIQGFFNLFSTAWIFPLNLFICSILPCYSVLIFIVYILYSAVDQFEKQIAHLEETGGEGNPLERKHMSLPR